MDFLASFHSSGSETMSQSISASAVVDSFVCRPSRKPVFAKPIALPIYRTRREWCNLLSIMDLKTCGQNYSIVVFTRPGCPMIILTRFFPFSLFLCCSRFVGLSVGNNSDRTVICLPVIRPSERAGGNSHFFNLPFLRGQNRCNDEASVYGAARRRVR